MARSHSALGSNVNPAGMTGIQEAKILVYITNTSVFLVGNIKIVSAIINR